MPRPRSSRYFDDGAADTADTVHVAERDHFTGLYDHQGEPIYRQPEPFGFQPHRWETAKIKKRK